MFNPVTVQSRRFKKVNVVFASEADAKIMPHRVYTLSALEMLVEANRIEDYKRQQMQEQDEDDMDDSPSFGETVAGIAVIAGIAAIGAVIGFVSGGIVGNNVPKIQFPSK